MKDRLFKRALKDSLIDFVMERYPYFVTGTAIEDFARTLGYKASNASRLCRLLENQHVFINKYNDKRFVSYCYVPEHKRGLTHNTFCPEITEADVIKNYDEPTVLQVTMFSKERNKEVING